jgi:hypothetical protein
MQEFFRERVLIDYTEDVLEPNPDGQSTRTVGQAQKKCEVEVTIHLHGILRDMARKACRSKSGKCQDGYVVVKRIGAPRTV